MSLADIRAHIETKVNTAFQNLSPPVEVVFDKHGRNTAGAPLCRGVDLVHRHDGFNGVPD